jgi:hypothetical protein
MKKRQEIGRGLRLPVDETGNRVFDPNINRLTVIANESYNDFAKQLQNEIKEDTGEEFKGRIENKRDRRKANLVLGWTQHVDFVALWERIQPAPVRPPQLRRDENRVRPRPLRNPRTWPLRQSLRSPSGVKRVSISFMSGQTVICCFQTTSNYRR